MNEFLTYDFEVIIRPPSYNRLHVILNTNVNKVLSTIKRGIHCKSEMPNSESAVRIFFDGGCRKSVCAHGYIIYD